MGLEKSTEVLEWVRRSLQNNVSVGFSEGGKSPPFWNPQNFMHSSTRAGCLLLRSQPQIWRSQSGYIRIAVSSSDQTSLLSPPATETRVARGPDHRRAELVAQLSEPAHQPVGFGAPSIDLTDRPPHRGGPSRRLHPDRRGFASLQLQHWRSVAFLLQLVQSASG